MTFWAHLYLHQTSEFFQSHWEIGSVSCHVWAPAYSTAKLPLSFLQIGELRQASSSALHCPWHCNTGQVPSKYSQLCGQKPVKTTQMWRYCRRQQAASGTSSRSSPAEWGERKAGTTLSSTPAKMHWRTDKW